MSPSCAFLRENLHLFYLRMPEEWKWYRYCIWVNSKWEQEWDKELNANQLSENNEGEPLAVCMKSFCKSVVLETFFLYLWKWGRKEQFCSTIPKERIRLSLWNRDALISKWNILPAKWCWVVGKKENIITFIWPKNQHEQDNEFCY